MRSVRDGAGRPDKQMRRQEFWRNHAPLSRVSLFYTIIRSLFSLVAAVYLLTYRSRRELSGASVRRWLVPLPTCSEFFTHDYRLLRYMAMEIPILLALVVISGVRGIDETTTTEKEFDETTTYSFVSTTDNAWTTTTTDAATSTSSASSTTTSSTTPNPNEWSDLGEKEAEVLVKFVVGEIQKLKVEHRELDDCQELDLSSVLSGKKQVGKPTKYSVTLKVQPQMKETEECKHDNSTLVNMHPEICEADILEGDHGGTGSKTLLRSTCLQVEELQD